MEHAFFRLLDGLLAGLSTLGEELTELAADVRAEVRSAARVLREEVAQIGEGFGERGADLREGLVETFTRIDDRYQQFMVERIDPLLGGPRHRQFHDIASGPKVIELSPDEKELNRNLACAGATMATVLVARALWPPLYLVSMGLAAYSMRIPAQRAYTALTREKRVKLPVLVTLNLAGTWLGGYFVIGGLGLVAFFLGEKLVVITRDRSHKSLISVFGQQARPVWALIDGVEVEIPFERLHAGDLIVVHAGQTVPADGVIVEGLATIDQHALTGESQPIEKGVGDRVYGATVALAGKIHVRVEKTGRATVAAQIGEILNRTTGYQMSIESKGMELAHASALPTLVLGGLAWPLVGYEAMVAILGASIGLNVKITGPIAMLNFLNIASTQAILVKDGRSLELLHTVDTVIFDKTGTLTLEQPQVVCVHRCGDLDTDTLLTYAAAAESRQTHPIARAILKAAAERGLSPPAFDQARYDVGYGIRVQIGGRLVRVGSDRYMAQEGIDVPDAIQVIKEACHAEGHSLVMVAVDDRLAGAIELSPTLRPEARKVIAELRRRDLRLVIISGDQEQPTRKMAQELGIDRYFANTLPENKAALVEQMQREGRVVCFVGDGINDAIALKTANVSISLRGATTAATDTAQIVLMAQSLHQLPYLFHLGDDFDATLRACLVAAVVPGVLIIVGAYLKLLGIAGALAIWTASLLIGLGIAVLPRYSRIARIARGPPASIERTMQAHVSRAIPQAA
ncbi:MAG: heavy metal translocating P-type ATPase [Gammaproteobacteria bacterium]